MSEKKTSFWLSLVRNGLLLAALAFVLWDSWNDSAHVATVILLFSALAIDVWLPRRKAKARRATRRQLEAGGARLIGYAHPPGNRALVRDHTPRSAPDAMRAMLGDQHVYVIFFDHPPTESELAQAAEFPEAAIYGPPQGEVGEQGRLPRNEIESSARAE